MFFSLIPPMSYDPCHEFDGLTQMTLGFFCLFLINFFSSALSFNNLKFGLLSIKFFHLF